MMAKVVIAVCVLNSIVAKPLRDESYLISYKSDVHPDGSCSFRYETNDGDKREEIGEIVTVDGDNLLKIKGMYTYIIDGKIYEAQYSADQNGYFVKTSQTYQSYEAESAVPVIETRARLSNKILESLTRG